MIVPVHIICDDFACGTKINNFDNLISVFRAKGISTMIMLQSESQLNSLYGEDKATTIINNCDTYIYMGGNDLKTARNISIRLNKPLDEVLYMKFDNIYLFQRGAKPKKIRRYKTLEDTFYKQYIEKVEEREVI